MGQPAGSKKLNNTYVYFSPLGSLCGCVAIWSPNMANEARSSADYEKKRKEMKDKDKKHVTNGTVAWH